MKTFQNYETIECRFIPDLNSEGMLLKHKKSGAYVSLLLNEDDNKVFYIGFKTPPKDSTGVAHILEHSVLCGSRNFPVKDPFIELAKGSLNTFLNAMTYPDKTVYPVASCNDKDFKNLVHVYLDAVFYPNIYREEKIFKQEGWHYEIEDIHAPITVNGVVYNEMKGAFSSPDDVVEREIMNSLYPDTTYGIESGGDPEVIPSLTYENFLSFHQKYYHPSNSFIYIYGNINPEEYLDFLHNEYLQSFDEIKVDSDIKIQEPFEQAKHIRKQYSVMEEDATEKSTYLTYNISVADCLDPLLYVALDVLDYVICTAPGAPLKQAIIDAGIGEDVYSTLETGIYQPYFSITAKNAELEDENRFVEIIEAELEKLVQNGISKKALKAALNHFEFQYREADFGSYPRGLMLGLQALDSWLYDKKKPFLHIEANETYGKIRNLIETDYFEQILSKYFLHNNHKTILSVVPERGLTQRKEKDLEEKLARYKESLSEEEVSALVSMTKELHAYQEEPSSAEDLAKIPMLRREDLKKEANPYVNEIRGKENMPILFHPVFTNGIGYLSFVFDLGKVPEELFPYIGIFKNLFLMMNTDQHTYGDLFEEVNLISGGIGVSREQYSRLKEDKIVATLEVKSKFLYERRKEVIGLIKEIILGTDFSDEKRLLEVLQEGKSRVQASMTSAGHSVAAFRAMSYFSKQAKMFDDLNGVSAFRLLERIVKDFDCEKEDLIQKLNELRTYIFCKDNLLTDYTAEESSFESLEDEVRLFAEELYDLPTEKKTYEPVPEIKNEGFTTSGQICYVCRAGNYLKAGLPYTGALRVLKVMMGYDYLWNQVRVLGGAYGCMSSFLRSGDAYFVSYRDPNLERTIDVFEKAADYIKNIELDERGITQFIIGAMSEMDVPMTPKAKGRYSLAGYMTGISFEEVQKERDEVLSVDLKVLKSMSEYIRSFINQDYVCVVGNSEKIKENTKMFLSIEQLFKS